MGVFRDILGIIGEKLVFPTHVGVFLDSRTAKMTNKGLPHARGGVSEDGDGGWRRLSSSPRTWGCFLSTGHLMIPMSVFPTHVGVFLASKYAIVFDRGLPHARGGVSGMPMPSKALRGSSPRTWGCFFERFVRALLHHVFPTHVGVFPPAGLMPLLFASLPHARGGVSATAAIQRLDCSSSPRTWGCFSNGGYGRLSASVFPTHVGYFKKTINCSILNKKHPYLCGVLFI